MVVFHFVQLWIKFQVRQLTSILETMFEHQPPPSLHVRVYRTHQRIQTTCLRYECNSECMKAKGAKGQTRRFRLSPECSKTPHRLLLSLKCHRLKPCFIPITYLVMWKEYEVPIVYLVMWKEYEVPIAYLVMWKDYEVPIAYLVMWKDYEVPIAYLVMWKNYEVPIAYLVMRMDHEVPDM
jgi:hypothetical protein